MRTFFIAVLMLCTNHAAQAEMFSGCPSSGDFYYLDDVIAMSKRNYSEFINVDACVNLCWGMQIQRDEEKLRRKFDADIDAITGRPATGAISIPLRSDRGTYTVAAVRINDAITLDFTLDTGASDVSIPKEIVDTLMRTGTLTSADYLNAREFELADGRTQSSWTFRIRSLKVGDTVVQDVVGSVAPGGGSLLLGQTFLQRFKSWSIDNDRKVLVLVLQ
jgi:clan AA aspartic protease (TIGR02281 family)